MAEFDVLGSSPLTDFCGVENNKHTKSIIQ